MLLALWKEVVNMLFANECLLAASSPGESHKMNGNILVTFSGILESNGKSLVVSGDCLAHNERKEV